MSRSANCPYCPARFKGYARAKKMSHIVAVHPEFATRTNYEHVQAGIARFLERARLVTLVWGWVCLRCGTKDRITIDHVIPLVAGGADDITNWQPLCFWCNNAKGEGATDYRPKPLPDFERILAAA